MSELLEIVLSVLAALGGGAIIIGGFAHWLGSLWAKRLIQSEKSKLDLEIESYKVKLKKSEFLFEKQYTSTSEFIVIANSILPRTREYRNMTWDEICGHIVKNFSIIEVRLSDYLVTHAAVLPSEVVDSIKICIDTAGCKKFDVHDPLNINNEEIESANYIYDKIKEVEKILINKLHEQTST